MPREAGKATESRTSEAMEMFMYHFSRAIVFPGATCHLSKVVRRVSRSVTKVKFVVTLLQCRLCSRVILHRGDHEVIAICCNPGDCSLMFVVWLCLVKRKHYIVSALTIFIRFNGIELLLRHDRNNDDTRLFQPCANASRGS